MAAPFANIQEPPVQSIIANTLAKFVDMDNIFSTNNIILFVSLAVTLLIVALKMKLISCPSDGILCRILEKIPILKSFVPAKKQVEFAPVQTQVAPDDEEDEEDDDEDDNNE